MRKMMLCAAIAASVCGCASLDPYRDAAVSKVADLNDRAAADAEIVLCRGISVGAWVRAYGQDQAKADAWKVLCRQEPAAVPAP